MTIERNDNDRDPQVSALYRDLADERTPAHLDQQVLRMAADARHDGVRPRGWFSAWIKPLGWAATIGLSVAIVLETTQFTEVAESDVASVAAAAPRHQSVREAFSVQEDTLLDEVEQQMRFRAGPNNQEAAIEHEAASSVNNRTASQGATIAQTPMPDSQPALPAASVDLASSHAAPQSPTDRQQAKSELFAKEKRLSSDAASDTADACDSAARKSADSWFSCIDALRKSGDFEAANRENEIFAQQYPEFLPSR